MNIAACTLFKRDLYAFESAEFESEPQNTGWRGVVGCLVFTDHFLQKSSLIYGSFAKNDLQLQASYGSSPLIHPVSVSVDRM